MEILRDDLKLLIQDFGLKLELNQAIREYYRLLRDYMAKIEAIVVVHRYKRFVSGGG